MMLRGKMAQGVRATGLCVLSLGAALPARAAFQHKWIDGVNAKKPDVCILGNSMLGCGINTGQLGKLSGTRVFRFKTNSKMSVWQYLVVKNIIGNTQHTPKLVISILRENFVTFPNMRPSVGKGLMDGDEKVLQELAFSLPGETYGGTAPYDRGIWDFSKAVDKSLLPRMVRIAEQKGFILVIARHRTNRFAPGAPNFMEDTAVHKKYRQDLATYLTERGMVFLDYTLNSTLKKEHYRAGKGSGGNDHLNGTGMKVWTSLMAEDVKAILAGRKAPNQITGRAGQKTVVASQSQPAPKAQAPVAARAKPVMPLIGTKRVIQVTDLLAKVRSRFRVAEEMRRHGQLESAGRIFAEIAQQHPKTTLAKMARARLNAIR